jgi:signal transduction histidine kinase
MVVRLEGQRIREVLDSLPGDQALPVRTAGPDEIIFQDGEKGDTAYLILDGFISIEKLGARGGTRQLARLQEGEVFGEMALLDGPIRSATARSGREGVRLLEISRGALAEIFHTFPSVARWLLKVLSHRLRIATKMTSEMEQIQVINRRIIDGQDQERRRIARDIHDGPAQQYANYSMRLQIIDKLLDRDLGQARQEIKDLQVSLGEGLDALRKLMHNLHNKDCKASGLETAIRKFVSRLSNDTSFQVEVDLEEGVTRVLPDHLKTTLYCLVQEAMNNIRKHASAAVVKVRLLPDGPHRCFLEVEDDGVGFDVDALFAEYHRRESLGMTSMKERTELAGGEMSICSTVGSGTIVRFVFPLEGGGTKVSPYGQENS